MAVPEGENREPGNARSSKGTMYAGSTHKGRPYKVPKQEALILKPLARFRPGRILRLPSRHALDAVSGTSALVPALDAVSAWVVLDLRVTSV